MAGRHFHLSSGAVFLLWLSAGVVLLLLPQRLTQKINFLFAGTFEPLLRIGRQFHIKTAPMQAPEEQYVLREEYNKLWKNNKNLQSRISKLQEQIETLSRIRTALPRFYSGLVIADVTGTAAGLTHELLINKGDSDGIRPGQYVMSPDQNSIIGVVRETSGQMARVRLLTDTHQSIEIRIRRDGTPLDVGGLMFGNGKRGGTISNITREKEIRPGDAVYAAARPGTLDIPMIIGEVAEVQMDETSPLLWKIVVQPAENALEVKTAAVLTAETAEGRKR